MQQIILLGAGKSATVLIEYLINNAKTENWQITIADIEITKLQAIYGKNDCVNVEVFNVFDETVRHNLIRQADVVISMVPARFHPIIAKDCLQWRKHLITPSYESEEMKAMAKDVENAGLIFLNEMGLDPGIDHMSAMKIIDELRAEGKEITRFESFTGGLIAPESDNNPWHYKFTWNPRNVIVAGQGGAVKFLHNGKYKYIPYHKLFDRTEIIEIENYGKFEGYANRDSLKYLDIYNLHGVKTIYRGTLRRPPFSKAWHILVQIGATDDTYIIDDSENMTYREFINSFLKFREGDSVELKLAYYLNKDVDSPEMELLKWAGLFSNEKIGVKQATPAQILQHCLEQKLALEPNDKDMIVMWHLFSYLENGVEKHLNSSLVVIGEDQIKTGMAKTVGLPLGIAAKLILNNQIAERGVLMPTLKSVYQPVLAELETQGIVFTEKEALTH